MANITRVVDATITTATTSLRQANFGTLLFVSSVTPVGFVDRVRSYATTSSLTDDGFNTYDPAYVAATSIFSQNPSPPNFKVGRRAAAGYSTKSVNIIPTGVVEGAVYTGSLRDTDGDTFSWSVTAGSGDGVDDVIDEIVTDLGSPTGLTLTDNVSSLNIESASAGDVWYIESFSINNTTVLDVTTDPGGTDLTTDLDAILAEDPDFYFVVLDTPNEVELEQAADWCSTNKKFLVATTCDTEAVDSGDSDDIWSTLATEDRKLIVWYNDQTEYLDAAIAAWWGTQTPGTVTLQHKAFKGKNAQSGLTSAQIDTAEAKFGAVYVSVAGVPMLLHYKPSAGDFPDTVRDLDWLENQLEVDLATLLANSAKIPYTSAGFKVIEGNIQTTLNRAVINGVLDGSDPENRPIVVVMPNIDDISAGDKANRLLPGVEISGFLAGAVHKVTITANFGL